MSSSNVSNDESGIPGTSESLPRIRWRPQPKKLLPILGMLSSGYSLGDGFSDALAGFTVGLSAVPQGIAFASIAGLPLQYGLYSSFMGCFVYTLFGTVPAITIGPTTLMALMVQKSVSIHPGYAALLALANGVIVLTCGLFRLGFLVDFVSTPVISAYTSAASITIASTQLKSLFGIKVSNKSSLPGILKTYEELFTNFNSLRWQDTLLGICSIIFLTTLKEIPSSKCLLNIRRDRPRDLAKKSTWLLSISRNAILVLVCASIAYGVDGGEEVINPTFILTGDIVGGLPQFQLPLFGINRTETITDPTAGQIISSLGTLLATLPMISILTQVAIARAFCES